MLNIIGTRHSGGLIVTMSPDGRSLIINPEFKSLIKYCVNASVTGIRAAKKSLTADGSRRSYDPDTLRVIHELSQLSNSLKPEQQERLLFNLEKIITSQRELQNKGFSKKEKREITNLRLQAGREAEICQMKMAAACDKHGLDPLDMVKGIMTALKESLPQAEPTHLEEQATSETELAALMQQIAHDLDSGPENHGN